MINDSLSYKIFRVCNTIFMLFMIVITLYPMLYVVFASLSDSTELMAHEGLLTTPLKTNINAYKMVFQNKMILTGYANTLYILVVGLIINMALTVTAAFVLSRKELPGVNIMAMFMVFTMYFSGGLIPCYLNVRELGLYDTYWAIILVSAMSAYNVIITRTAFFGIPKSLEESARLDGAGYMTVLIKIFLPLTKPTLMVIVLYYAVAHWNAWFNAMIYLQDRAKYPLQLVLREILIQSNTENMTFDVAGSELGSVAESVKYAVIVVSTLPILLVYPFLQKYFVKGVMVGAVKG